jgi:hypothetical protein
LTTMASTSETSLAGQIQVNEFQSMLSLSSIWCCKYQLMLSIRGVLLSKERKFDKWSHKVAVSNTLHYLCNFTI